MAHVSKVYIPELLQLLCEAVEEDVGVKVYSEHRPLALEELRNEFLVVSFPTVVRDYYAYQKTTVRISVYVKNKTSGIVNTLRLGELSQSVFALFPYVSGRYSLTKPVLTLKTDDGLGFTVWIIQANALINSTDAYEYEN